MHNFAKVIQAAAGEVYLQTHAGQILLDDADLWLTEDVKAHLHEMGFNLDALEAHGVPRPPFTVF